MSLTLTRETQNNGATVTTSVTPSWNGDGYDGNDTILVVKEDGKEIGRLNFFLKPNITYSTSTNSYLISWKLRVYSPSVKDSTLAFRITQAGFGGGYSVNGLQYTSWTNMDTLVGSSKQAGYSTVVSKNPGSSSDTFSVLGTVTVQVFNDTSSNLPSQIMTVPTIAVAMGKNNFSVRYESNGAGWTTRTQKLYYGSSPDPIASPNQPSDSLNRTINVVFTPTDGNESAITSTAQVIDSWTSNRTSWPSDPIYSDTTYSWIYSRVYSSSPVMIPAWSTQDGKPTRNGYLFNYWDYSGTNIGSEPGTQTNYSFGSGGGTSYSTSARWTETSSDYIIYPKYKIGDEIFDVVFPDDSGSTNTRVEFSLNWEGNKDVSTISFKSFLKNGLRVDSSKVYNLKNNAELTSISGKSQDKEYYVLYNIIQDQVTLNLNGGNINGNTSNIVIPYNRFSGGISIKSDYKPIKDNTTFVAWLDTATNVYVDEIDPSTQTTWPSNKTLLAEYIPIGFFMCRKDSLGKLYWEAIINKWVMHEGEWKGEYNIPGTEIVHTSTSAWVLKNGVWKLEYGKQDLPLS